MPYLSRLSHRLAASFVALSMLAACSSDDLTGNSSPLTSADTTVTTTSKPSSPATHAGFHVAPGGSTSNDGTSSRPWTLSYALAGAGGRIHAGDTVWLRKGTYAGAFRTAIAGTSSQPIVFRQYPGERATIDGTLRVDGPDVAFWGFEIMMSNPSAYPHIPALQTFGARTKFINLVIHDANQQGITFWDGADNAEVYGCIVYNNGQNENLDHGTYVHNSSGATKVLSDNVFFNNLAWGIHVYAGPEDAPQRNVHLIGNVSFNNGTISNNVAAKGNLIIGAEVPGSGHKVLDNMLYMSGSVGQNMRIGYTVAGRDVEVRGNLVWGGRTALMVGQWSDATFAGNRVGGSADMVELAASAAGQSWNGNEYYRPSATAAWLYSGQTMTLPAFQVATGLAGSDVAWSGPPASAKVIVRANKYEKGRANVVVYNWPQSGSVSVDLSAVLTRGQRYEVRNVQAMYGSPVASGTYSGGSIVLAMNGVAPPARLGRSTPTPPRTAPAFDTFVVIPIS